MRIYEIVLDGQLAVDLSDSVGLLPRREEAGSTVLSVPASAPQTLAQVLDALESLGIGVTAMRQVEEPGKEPVRESAPTFPMRAVPEPASPPPPPPAPSGPHRDSAPTFRLRPVPQWATDQREGEGGPAGEDRPVIIQMNVGDPETGQDRGPPVGAVGGIARDLHATLDQAGVPVGHGDPPWPWTSGP